LLSPSVGLRITRQSSCIVEPTRTIGCNRGDLVDLDEATLSFATSGTLRVPVLRCERSTECGNHGQRSSPRQHSDREDAGGKRASDAVNWTVRGPVLPQACSDFQDNSSVTRDIDFCRPACYVLTYETAIP
jgi:hypothetical protein